MEIQSAWCRRKMKTYPVCHPDGGQMLAECFGPEMDLLVWAGSQGELWFLFGGGEQLG